MIDMVYLVRIVHTRRPKKNYPPNFYMLIRERMSGHESRDGVGTRSLIELSIEYEAEHPYTAWRMPFDVDILCW